jgi:hypothetical protein
VGSQTCTLLEQPLRPGKMPGTKPRFNAKRFLL